MRVLVLTHRPIHPPLYGYSRVILDTCRALSRLGLKVGVLTISPTRSSRAEVEGVSLISVREPRMVFARLLAPRALLRLSRGELLFFHLLQLMKSYSSRALVSLVGELIEEIGRPDLVVSETIYPSALGREVSEVLGAPHVVRVHNVESEYVSSLTRTLRGLSRKLIERAEIAALSRADSVVAMSRSDAARLGEILGSRVEYVPPIVIPSETESCREFLEEHSLEEREYFAYVASPHRPNVEFLKAIVKCSRELGEREYKIAIGGSISSVAAKLLRKVSASNVVVTGVLSSEDLYSLIKSSYAVLAPHHGSGVPIKLVEPLVVGAPTITTENSLATIEGLQSGVNVYAVKSAEGLCSAMLELIDNEELYSRISSGVKSLAKDLSYASTAKRLALIFERVARASNQP